MSVNGRDSEQEEPRPRVRVTDKRRARPDAPEGEAPAGSGGSSGSGASGRSEAPPATTGAEPSPPASPHAEQTLEEYRDHLQRLAADFDNYRKRVLKEQTRAVEMASEPLMRRLLEVLDEFELALMAAERKPDFDKFLHGVELVYAKLLETLRSEGLERIEAQGRPFDPSMHEALMQSGEGASDEVPVVGDVLRQGYTLRGRIIRPAGVKVVRR